jgi:hypothetical protein
VLRWRAKSDLGADAFVTIPSYQLDTLAITDEVRKGELLFSSSLEDVIVHSAGQRIAERPRMSSRNRPAVRQLGTKPAEHRRAIPVRLSEAR